uniref:Inter-alpha-trypsin inhibitor heavy chain 4 n=1 Tax=Capra hircus TaxID=9925 RepID=A0A8C2SJH9_CAPHI
MRFFLVCGSVGVGGQGLVWDQGQDPLLKSIKHLTVDSKVSSRFAHTVITSRVVNKADAVREATFQMELPKKAFITNFSMVIDGVTYPGNIKEKAAAQEQYSAAMARGESAGLVTATGRKTEQFQVSVSVAPAAKVTFELVYEELLARHLGVYELLLKVRPQQLVKHLQMDIHIFEPQGISFLETESTFMTNELAEALTTSQNKTKAHVRFKPTLSQQQKSPEKQDTVLDGNFIVRYDVDRPVSGGSIQIENGYFVHYFAPDSLSTMPKNVIFVIDKSGSMMGRKIKQTQEALIKILDDLSPHDQFNLISFSAEATKWKPLLVPASTENVNEAKSYATGIRAQGGTNINDAMLMAVQLLEKANREELLPAGSITLIILLTDGDPTAGETDPLKIQENVRKAVNGQHSLFCLGFGFDVSYAFLEKMALENGGLARRIYEDSDSALQLQDFYQEVANPLMMSVAFEYPSNAVESVTQDAFRVFFKGSELVVAGKLRDHSPDVLSAQVRGQLHGENITFVMESHVAEQEEMFRGPKYIFHSFMERLWAYLTIQQLLEQMWVNTSSRGPPGGHPRPQHLPRLFTGRAGTAGGGLKLLNSPPRLGVPGPWWVAGSSDGWRACHLLRILTAFSLSVPELTPAPAPSPTSGPGGASYDMDFRIKGNTPAVPAPIQAPSVILPLPGQSVDQLCVDFRRPQELVNLLSDPDQGVEVTGHYETAKACFSWIEVTFENPQLQVHASPEHVVITRNRRNSAYKWKETLYSVMPGLKVTMDKAGLLLLSRPDRVTIGLLFWDGPGKGLRLLLQDTDRFSSHVSGTLGQFYQDVLWGPLDTADDRKRTLKVQGRDYSATRELKLDYQESPPGKEISCWSVEL